MPRTKEQQAEYMREYRARQKADLAARATRPSSQDPQVAVKPVNIHAACDAQITGLTAEVRRLNSLVMVYQPVYEGMRDAPGNAAVAQTMLSMASELPVTVSRETKPSFLAAPDEDCVCGHDRHAYHLAGTCSASVGRRKCPCVGFQSDLGFE